MKRIALIKDGIVKNVAIVEEGSEWTPEGYDHLIDVTDIFCGPKFTYENGQFSPPIQEEIADEQ